MPPALYLPEARDDIDEGYTSYETQSAGLGDRFLDALRRTIGLIEANPACYGEVAPGVRAGVLRRFPYVVYYQENAGQVLVVAMRHGRDNPSIWQARAVQGPNPQPPASP